MLTVPHEKLYISTFTIMTKLDQNCLEKLILFFNSTATANNSNQKLIKVIMLHNCILFYASSLRIIVRLRFEQLEHSLPFDLHLVKVMTGTFEKRGVW